MKPLFLAVTEPLMASALGTGMAALAGKTAEVAVVTERATLELTAAQAHRQGRPMRLLAFATQVFVPRAVIDRLDTPGHNLHPGPPWRPGIMPELFAVLEGDGRFGATLHVLATKTDSGDIVATALRPRAATADIVETARIGLDCALGLLAAHAPDMIAGRPLTPSGECWSGTVRRKADIGNYLGEVPADDIRRSLLAPSDMAARSEMLSRQIKDALIGIATAD